MFNTCYDVRSLGLLRKNRKWLCVNVNNNDIPIRNVFMYWVILHGLTSAETLVLKNF